VEDRATVGTDPSVISGANTDGGNKDVPFNPDHRFGINAINPKLFTSAA
jgi:hypothetical protein